MMGKYDLRYGLLLMILLCLTACSSGSSHDAASSTGSSEEATTESLYVGTGKADVTGTPALVVFMGMADSTQQGQGIQDRSYARAFVFKQDDKKMAYVTADIGMIFQGVKQAVVRELADEGWNDDNLMLQGTHTHATPGGASHYFMYKMAASGFVQENFDVQVNGIVAAIRQAEAGLKPTPLKINADDLFQCGWNRSPRAYNNNPQAEIKHYGRVSDITDIDQEAGFTNVENLDPEDREHLANGLSTGYVDGIDWNNTNKRMTLLKIGDDAMVNWFALHPTTLGSLFRYISGDNKGYAEALWERRFPDMIGAFAQANCGDVSGNIMYGPPSTTAIYDWQHCKELGRRQFDKALALYNNANNGERTLTPTIDYRHIFVNFSSVTSTDAANPWQTCKAAMGGPFSAGSSEDSRSPMPLFREGVTVDDLSSDGAANLIERFIALLVPDVLGLILPGTLAALSDEYKQAQYPKVILLPTGYMMWTMEDGDTGEPLSVPSTPEILPVQLFRIGELILCGMPVEVTTMAGRRIENTIKLVFNGDSDSDGLANDDGPIRYVVVGQCANTYVGYTTTKEEYQKQYYEGASTQFGPHELEAFQQVIATLAASMKNGTTLDKMNEPIPPYMNGSPTAESYTGRLSWPFYDRQTDERPFGGIVKGPYFEVDPDGTTYLKLKVWGAFPNRNLMTGQTYMTVKTPANSTYVLAPESFTYTDADPETRFQWEQVGLDQAYITLWFDMTNQPTTGTYEFTYTSQAKTLTNVALPIHKKYTFTIEKIGTDDFQVAISDF